MLRGDIDELGAAAFSTVVKPLAELPTARYGWLGWDTEYDSKTGKFLCFQLYGSNGGILSTDKMTVDSLARAARKLGIQSDGVFLVSYFSIAELQFLPVVTDSNNWRLYGNGSLDVTFHSDRYSLDLHTLDLARFFDKQPLASVAQSFGMKKLEFDTKKVSKASLKSARFREYAIHDAKLCYEILRELKASLGGPDPLVHKTAPGCAAALFRHRYLTKDLEPPDPRYRLLAMLGCWGGRAEAFRRGHFPRLLEYDLRSAYPQAALDLGVLPTQRSWRSMDKMPRYDSISRYRGGFFRVQFQFPQSVAYPCLPILSKGVQIYPRKGESFCTLAELTLARKLQARVTVMEGSTYTSGSKELAQYMAELLSERQSATGARKVALKLLANSLIGKLAQRVSGIDVEKLRKLAIETGIDLTSLAKLTIQEAKALGVDTGPKVGGIFYPEWNGLITGYVRAQIGGLIAEHGAVYAATDAIWVEKPLRKVPAELSLKREGPGVVARSRLGLIGIEGSAHVAHHGIWNRAAAEQLLRYNLDGQETYKGRRPTKLRESLRDEIEYGKWQEYEREASAEWDYKRRLLPDGRTEPWDTAAEFEREKAAANKARAKRRKERTRHGS